MNSVFNHIRFTSEVPGDFENNRLPTLDFSMWIGKDHIQEGENKNGKIIYNFYEKEINSKFCVMERTAMSENSKTSTLSQDLIRRMMNTSELVDQQERNATIEKYIDKLKVSGYSEIQVKNIIESGLKGYETKLNKARREKREIHRAAEETQEVRFRKKILGKVNWFKSKKSKNEYPRKNQKSNQNKATPKSKESKVNPVTVLFIPRTPGGVLINKLREAETEISRITGDRITG